MDTIKKKNLYEPHKNFTMWLPKIYFIQRNIPYDYNKIFQSIIQATIKYLTSKIPFICHTSDILYLFVNSIINSILSQSTDLFNIFNEFFFYEVIFSPLTSKEFQDSKMKISRRAGMELWKDFPPFHGSIKIS